VSEPSAPAAQIGVGIPVFNEAARIQACLENVAAQSFGDFRAAIVDNASTDATGEIARAFASRDPRFSYVRQPENRGAIANFSEAFRRSGQPYFLWKAGDDRWEANYLQALHALLEAHPRMALAAGKTVGFFRGEVIRRSPPPPARPRSGFAATLALMFGAAPSWVYGLWRREALVRPMRAWDAYGPNPWAADFMLMLPAFMDRAVIGTDATTFQQALRPRLAAAGERPPPRTEIDLDVILGVRRRFVDLSWELIEERVPPGPRRALWRALLFAYADRRVYKTRHIIRRRLMRSIGLGARQSRT